MAGTCTAVELEVQVSGEKADLLVLLADQRELLRVTARGITEQQARQASTVSTLTLGGLVKHVAHGERETAEQILARDENSEVDLTALGTAYELAAEETLSGWLEEYERAALFLDQTVAAVESLDELIPQPTAPWAPERQWWSVRRMVAHRLRETAHHCGHADIIREALDGQSTMAVISADVEWPEQ